MNSDALRIKIIVEVLRQGHCTVSADLLGEFVDTAPASASVIEIKARELAQVNHLKLTREFGDGLPGRQPVAYVYQVPHFTGQPCENDGEHAPRLAKPHPVGREVARDLMYSSGPGRSLYLCDQCAFISQRDYGFVSLAHEHQKMSLRMSLTEALLYLAETGGALSFDKHEADAAQFPHEAQHVTLTIWSELKRGPQVFRLQRRIFLPELYQYTEEAIAATVTEFVSQGNAHVLKTATNLVAKAQAGSGIIVSDDTGVHVLGDYMSNEDRRGGE